MQTPDSYRLGIQGSFLSERLQEGADSISPLIDRARTLKFNDRPAIIGISGPPGAGKSTIALQLCEALGDSCISVPMDGFHLANRQLVEQGLQDRKGAIETFDGFGFVALLRRIRESKEPVIYAPSYERSLEEPVAGAIAIFRGLRTVIVEGNYLLVDSEPWNEVRNLLDESWYVTLDDQARIDRLVRRHVIFGKSEEHAWNHVQSVDEENARFIATTAQRANLIWERKLHS